MIGIVFANFVILKTERFSLRVNKVRGAYRKTIIAIVYAIKYSDELNHQFMRYLQQRSVHILHISE